MSVHKLKSKVLQEALSKNAVKLIAVLIASMLVWFVVHILKPTFLGIVDRISLPLLKDLFVLMCLMSLLFLLYSILITWRLIKRNRIDFE